MASVSTSDKTGPVAQLYGIDANPVGALTGTSPAFSVTKEGKYFNMAPDIAFGDTPPNNKIRVVYEFPWGANVIDRQKRWHTPIAWFLTAGGVIIIINPVRMTAFSPVFSSYDWENPVAGSEEFGGDGNLFSELLVPGQKYVYEFERVSIDELGVTVWNYNGGAPLATQAVLSNTNLLTSAAFFVGWPNHPSTGVDLPLTISTEQSLSSVEAAQPDMLKIHEITNGNIGPTGAVFTQQTTLTQAEDLPAGTYVGYFEPTHDLGIKSHVYHEIQQNNFFDAEYDIINNKLYTKVRGGLLGLTGAPPQVMVTDVFNVSNQSVTASGDPLIVSAL